MLGGNRPLPNFLILGTQRGGTTSLHEDLYKHQLVARPLAKEIQFFTLNFDRGDRWYRSHFPRLRPGQLTFESSPYYLFHPAAPARAAAMLPAAKFIVLLRNPTRRAYSHYLHSCALGVETLPFEEAIAAEELRLKEADTLGIDSPEGRRIHRNFSYQARGLYAEQLRRWLTYVPSSRVNIQKSEAWFKNPDETFSEVLDFLELPRFTPKIWAMSNSRRSSAPPMHTDTQMQLNRYFAADSEELRRLLGWKTAWE